MKKLLMGMVATLSFASGAMAMPDILCINDQTKESISILDNGQSQDGENLKKLVHSTGTELIPSLMCSNDDTGIICFSATNSDKFFVMKDDSNVNNFILVANSKEAKKAASKSNLKAQPTELGEAYLIKNITCSEIKK